MPDPGHRFTRQAGKSSWDYIRQRFPGFSGIGPSTSPREGRGTTCEPSNPIAALVAAVLWDPCVRGHLELLLEEAFRNFRSPSQLPPWVDPPFAALHGTGSIIDGSSTVNIPPTSVWTDVRTGDVMKGHRTTLHLLGQDVAVAAAWVSVSWRIIRRGFQTAANHASTTSLGRAYETFTDQWGQIEAPTPIVVEMRGPCTWALQASNAHIATGYDVVGRIMGWTYPARVDDDHAGGTIVD